MVSENIYEEIVREMWTKSLGNTSVIGMKTNTKEYRRDLQRDLEICERATPGPWKFFENSNIIVNETDVWICEVEWNNDKQFIAEAREGWPHAIRRAIAAEKRVAELEAENERLREQLRDLNEYKRLAEWGLRKVFGEERTARHGV